jgi:hypothetical protein
VERVLDHGGRCAVCVLVRRCVGSGYCFACFEAAGRGGELSGVEVVRRLGFDTWN